MQETYEYYKEDKIDFCLSMRLHSMILSQVYGINFIGLKYSKK
jgi:polysaccharide pyruvyl transferase WcaK-like protein